MDPMGAIPLEDQGDDQEQGTDVYGTQQGPNTDSTSTSLAGALKAVNDALMYGRRKNGLIPGSNQQPQQKQQDPESSPAIPDDQDQAQEPDNDEDDQPTQNFAEGGAVEDETPGEAVGEALGAAPDDEAPAPVQAPGQGAPQMRPDDQGMATQAEQEEPGVSLDKIARSPGGRAAKALYENVKDKAGAIGEGAKTIMNYLSGADAAHPDTVKMVENEIDPQGQMEPAYRHMRAIEYSQQNGGDDAAYRMLQAGRKKYDQFRGMSAAALHAGDVVRAARAATSAYDNLPDGDSVQFQPGPHGITATVKTKDGDTSQIPLSPEQFNEWVHGQSGQFDRALSKGGVATLQAVASSGKQSGAGGGQQGAPRPHGAPNTPSILPNAQASGPAQRAQQAWSAVPLPGQQGAPQGGQPGQGGGQYHAPPPGQSRPSPFKKVQFDPRAEAISRSMFPLQSQTKQRLEWLMGQEQQGAKNNIEMAKARREYAVEQARIRSQGGIDREAVKQEGALGVADRRGQSYDQRTQATSQRYAQDHAFKLAQIAARSQDVNVQQGARMLSEKIRAGGALSPGEQQAVNRLLGIQSPQGGGQQPPAQQQAPQQGSPQMAQGGGQQGAPKVGTEKQFKQGVGVWDGTKWVPKGQ